MAYARASSQPEVLRLRDEITREVNGDAEHLATAVFGKPADMPDMQKLDDDTLKARFRQAYQNQDRKWLVAESQRDPEQFVKTARSIGVMLPDELPPQPAPAVSPTPPVPPMLPQPTPAAVPPVPVPPMAAPPLPLPGAVATPGQPVPLTVPGTVV